MSARSGLLFILAFLALGGCTRRFVNSPSAAQATPAATTIAPAPATSAVDPQSVVEPTPAAVITATATVPAAVEAAQSLDRGPFTMEESHCGVHLPVVAPLTPVPPAEKIVEVNVAMAQIPEGARPAVQYMLANPGGVALVAYEAGRESQGIFLNADNPRPLASVVKVLHLVAYARAVQLGELDPATFVPLAELERYYLPNSDLGSHPRAVAELLAEERVFGQPPSVLLEDVPRMMIEYSSNAATDYLHMLLGQERIEQTAIAVGMIQQTAPCPFLGQFLLMGRRAEGIAPVQSLFEDPRLYSRSVMSATEQYIGDVAFRTAEGAWSSRERRPSLEAQQLFSEQLNAHGTAREYANLMAQIALNTLGPWEESVRIRRYMEWPTHFPDNQEQLAWLGYKGGSLPGVLTVVYYAQPWDTIQPVVVALFFHDLPTEIYRDWRRSLPHDELARWLLREREAIPLLRTLFLR